MWTVKVISGFSIEDNSIAILLSSILNLPVIPLAIYLHTTLNAISPPTKSRCNNFHNLPCKASPQPEFHFSVLKTWHIFRQTNKQMKHMKQRTLSLSKTSQTTPCWSTSPTLLTPIYQMSPEYLWQYLSSWQTSLTQLRPWPSLNISFAPLQGRSHRYSDEICPIDHTNNINRTDFFTIPLTMFPFPRWNHHNWTPQYCHQTKKSPWYPTRVYNYHDRFSCMVQRILPILILSTD